MCFPVLAVFMIEHLIDIISCFYYTLFLLHCINFTYKGSGITGHNLSRKIEKMSNKSSKYVMTLLYTAQVTGGNQF